MAVRWYNPLTWRFFGYTDPQTGDYREVDMEVGGRKTKAGVRITAKTAITVPIVWTCVKILSESAAGLPLKLYQDVGGKRTLVRGDSPANKRALRLLGKPNPYITRLNLLKAVVVNMALRGNAFVIIERNRQGEMIGLIPVGADDVSIDTDDDLLYIVELKGQRIPVSPENMLHFKLFSTDGVTGLSPLEYQAEAMGLAKAGQDWSARFMRKGGFTGGYVVYDQFLTKEQQGQIMEKFPDVRKGDVDDIGKIAVLQGGPKLIPAGLSQKDSQFIESQQFQEEALAGVWGVPLYLANRAGRTSIMGSNLEQQNSGFVTYGLKPYLDAIEDEWNDKIHRGTEVFVEFVVEGLLRGDSAARSTYYKAALGGSGGSGWMSINDVRLKENLPRLEGAQYDAITQWESQGNDRQQN
ncbi:phage portal protein [Stenotrophomonas rhizophila]|uniref:phage portal protein n=1 Tax=Stenotrophomonas rhizophila TaxID=216778 RepID=UPI0033951E4F